MLLSVATTFLIALGAVGVLYGEEIYEATLPAPVTLSLEEWLPEPGRPLQPLSRREESAAQRVARRRREQAAAARASRIRDAREMAQEAREAQVNDLDLDQPGRTGRSFQSEELSRQVGRRSARLERCFRAEQQRNSGQTSFVVRVTVKPSGRVLNGNLRGGSAEGNRCVFRALKGLRVSSFDGTNAVVSYPFDIR